MVRHGFLRLLHCLKGGALEPSNDDISLRRFRNRGFMHGVTHFQACFWKQYRAAAHIERCRAAISAGLERWRHDEGRGIPSDDVALTAQYNALEDLPLHLDSMMFYLRIEADAFAQLLPHFYKRTNVLPSNSFHDQSVWFIKRSYLDPEYTALLHENLRWFKTLAALRDVLVHYAGTYQVAWTEADSTASFALQPGLVRHSGYVEEDVISALREISFGWFQFLDAASRHFASRLAAVLPGDQGGVDILSRYLQLNGMERQSDWCYPRSATAAE